MLTPQQRASLERNRQWVASSGGDILADYNKAIGYECQSFELYPDVDGVHVRVTTSNGLELDFLVPGADTESIIQEFRFGKEVDV